MRGRLGHAILDGHMFLAASTARPLGAVISKRQEPKANQVAAAAAPKATLQHGSASTIPDHSCRTASRMTFFGPARLDSRIFGGPGSRPLVAGAIPPARPLDLDSG